MSLVAGVGPPTTARPDVGRAFRALLAATERVGAEPENLAVRRPTLEDVFLDLTGRALRD